LVGKLGNRIPKIIDKVLGTRILQFAAIYVDDNHIMSTNFQEHIQHLELVFKIFKEFNVTIDLQKSQFLRNQIIFLGHVVSEKRIMMDPKKNTDSEEFAATQKQKNEYKHFWVYKLLN